MMRAPDAEVILPFRGLVQGLRWVARAEPIDQQGQRQVRELSAGDHLAIALDYIEDGAWNHPEYLRA